MPPQTIKDTFYQTLRDRIANANPARTIVLRGTIRPAVIVLENELPTATPNPDTFTLTWSGLDADPQGLLKLTCAIRYATAGTPGAAGMDRGRALAAMDEELRAATGTAPQSANLVATAEIPGGGITTQTSAGTRIFWTDPVFAPTLQRNELLQRTATIEVFGDE